MHRSTLITCLVTSFLKKHSTENDQKTVSVYPQESAPSFNIFQQNLETTFPNITAIEDCQKYFLL